MTDLDPAVIDALRGCTIDPCGSRVTCDPAPLETDRDFLVQLPDNRDAISDVIGRLGALGFSWEGSQHYQDAAGEFMSWRLGEINLIVTANEQFATRHRVATHLCKRLNLQHKPDRIALFHAVLYGKRYEEAT